MGKKRARSKGRAPVVSTPSRTARASVWRARAAVTGAALAMQAVVWSLLYWLLGVARIGYSFFDFSDINYYYQTYITRMAQGLVPFRGFFIEYPPLLAILLAAPGPDVGPEDDSRSLRVEDEEVGLRRMGRCLMNRAITTRVL